MDSTAEGTRSVHYRANGAECSGDCDVRCKDEGGDELRRLMRRINDQRMMVLLSVHLLASALAFYFVPGGVFFLSPYMC